MTKRWRSPSLLRWLLAGLVPLLASGCEAAFFSAVNATARDGGLEVHRGITYIASEDLKLDVYAPANASSAPVVVLAPGRTASASGIAGPAGRWPGTDWSRWCPTTASIRR